MKKKIKIIVANPAGNITIFVKDSFDRSEYTQVARQLLEMKELRGEQVAFILDTPSCGRAEGKMEMCGLEFCGNASRSFGLIKARELGIEGQGSVFVDVSGCDEILTIDLNTESSYTKVKMPNPVGLSNIDLSSLAIGDAADAGDVPAIDFGGILHVILRGIPATEKNFAAIKDFIMTKFNPPALGVMFCSSDIKKDCDALICAMTPVVYVKDVDTTYFEGSCGSGTTACAASFGLMQGDGIHHFVFRQPAGTIESTAHISDRHIEKIFIEGEVELSAEREVEIEV